MNKIQKIIKILLKNLLIFLLGGLVTTLLMFLFLARPALERVAEKAGLGVIALGPVVLITYTILSVIIGGIISIIGFNVIKLIKRKIRK